MMQKPVIFAATPKDRFSIMVDAGASCGPHARGMDSHECWGDDAASESAS